jgi:predicted MPP superfamily phosphohydrolase
MHPKHTLFLFGHTHHGQIHLPFAPSVAIPTDSDFYRGVYRLKQGTIYVSSGTGETTTPTRLNAPPEIVVIEISIDSEKVFSIPA